MASERKLWTPHFRTFCELVEGEENKLTTFSTWIIMLGCNESNNFTHPCVPTVYACEVLVAFIWCLCKKYESFKSTKIPRHHCYILSRTSRVLLSQFEWKSRDSPTETRLTDRTDSLSFVTPANFPRAVTDDGQ